MWIFSKTGFYRVVVDNQNAGYMLIRSRCKADIENLYAAHHQVCPSMSQPTSNELRDYRWRLGISKADWLVLASRLADGIDYSNFKQACHNEPSQDSKSGALMAVWRTMMGRAGR